MMQPRDRLKRITQTALLLVGLLVLGACGSLNPSSPSAPPKAAYYLLTLALQASDTQTALEQKYGGTVVAWLEGQKAVLRLNAQAMAAFQRRGVSLQSEVLEADQPITQTEAEATGWNAWAGGWNAWAGGWNAWAGGWNAWAGGINPPAPPAANQEVWQQIRLAQAQRISRNLGGGVKVAILDSGIDLGHPMFQGRLAASSELRDFVDGDNSPQEGARNGRAYGHGTGVAGIIAQVAPRATLVPIRVLDSDGSGWLSQIVGGIYWAADHAQIINLSLGSSEWSQTLFDALRYASQKGVYIVASAGNNGKSEGIALPARLSWNNELNGHLMGIGSVDRDYLISSFSNYGSDLFLSAPGEKITSSFPDYRVAQLTGTSFATPLVSGAMALLLADSNPMERTRLGDELASGSLQGGVQSKNRASRGTDRLGVGILDIESALYNLSGFEVSSVNSVQETGFEENLSGWATTNAQIGSLEVHRGQKALEISGSGKASRDFAVKPNTNYVASVWVKAAPGNRPGMWIWGFDQTGKLGNSRSNTVAGSDTYTKLSLAFTTGSSDTSIQIGVWSNSGIAHFDDLALTEVGY